MKAPLRAVAVAKKMSESRDGKSKYYKIALVQDGDLIEFDTSEEVYHGAELYKEHAFELTLTRGEYQGKVYERRLITSILK